MYDDRHPPARCPNGHQLGPYKVLVGWDNLRRPPCRSWTCRTCCEVIYATPPQHSPANHPRGL